MTTFISMLASDLTPPHCYYMATDGERQATKLIECSGHGIVIRAYSSLKGQVDDDVGIIMNKG